MRRITIYTDEDSAAKAVAWLEQHGFDYMAEDYAEPTLKRREPPQRRVQPERSEPSPGMLKPLMKFPLRRPALVQKGPGRKLGRFSLMILEWLKEAGQLTRDDMHQLAKDSGLHPKLITDTLRRLEKSGRVLVYGDGIGYSLPRENEDG